MLAEIKLSICIPKTKWQTEMKTKWMPKQCQWATLLYVNLRKFFMEILLKKETTNQTSENTDKQISLCEE